MKSDKQRAQALVVLKESEGWKIIEREILKPTIDGSINSVMSRKKAKGMVDVAYYQGKYDLASKLIFLIDKWIADGVKASEDDNG